ncbi:hypothetical protein BJ508DRAFT_310065 [Ascobolus immersus RN42]|uniref:Uncharacterized protein n=1 Tax=Ascobolus immersus RN42 TaxID=1160509 RepID=A0A3N4HYL8_ASCIM|nr:hypothetical protein BJ508DRAFT_310065 [Ascobolus immersus RN42]
MSNLQPTPTPAGLELSLPTPRNPIGPIRRLLFVPEDLQKQPNWKQRLRGAYAGKQRDLYIVTHPRLLALSGKGSLEKAKLIKRIPPLSTPPPEISSMEQAKEVLRLWQVQVNDSMKLPGNQRKEAAALGGAVEPEAKDSEAPAS